jgi:hypothetical protein
MTDGPDPNRFADEPEPIAEALASWDQVVHTVDARGIRNRRYIRLIFALIAVLVVFTGVIAYGINDLHDQQVQLREQQQQAIRVAHATFLTCQKNNIDRLIILDQLWLPALAGSKESEANKTMLIAAAKRAYAPRKC